MCPESDFETVKDWFYSNGFVAIRKDSIWTNFFSFVDVEHNMTFDCASYIETEHSFRSGFLSKTNLKRRSMIQNFSKFEYEEDSDLFPTTVFMPTNRERVLEDLYGPSWLESNPDWIPFIMDKSNEDTPMFRFYAYERIIGNWDAGHIKKAMKAAIEMSKRCPDDHLNSAMMLALSKLSPN